MTQHDFLNPRLAPSCLHFHEENRLTFSYPHSSCPISNRISALISRVINSVSVLIGYGMQNVGYGDAKPVAILIHMCGPRARPP